MRNDELLELFPVTDIYSDGYELECLGDNMRVIHFTWTKPIGERLLRRVVVAKLIRPRVSMKQMAGQNGALISMPRPRLPQ